MRSLPPPTTSSSGRRIRTTSTVAVTTVVMLVVLASSSPATAAVGFDLSRPTLMSGRAVIDPRETEDPPVDSAALARMLRRLMAGGSDGSLSVLVSKVWAGQRASLVTVGVDAAVPPRPSIAPRTNRYPFTLGVIGQRSRVHARLHNLPPPFALSLRSVGRFG